MRRLLVHGPALVLMVLLQGEVAAAMAAKPTSSTVNVLLPQGLPGPIAGAGLPGLVMVACYLWRRRAGLCAWAGRLPGQPGRPQPLVLAAGLVCEVALVDPAWVLMVYSSIPLPTPSVDSLVYETSGTSTFGDAIGLGGTARLLTSATVLVSAGTVESGYETHAIRPAIACR